MAALVQARMSSSRLPGKVLRPLAGRLLVSYILDSLERCVLVDSAVLTTSVDPSDDPIADFSVSTGVDCFRGALDDVASRFLDAADAFGLDAFVRVNGDSPLLDHRLVDRAVELSLAASADLATNPA